MHDLNTLVLFRTLQEPGAAKACPELHHVVCGEMEGIFTGQSINYFSKHP